MTATISRRRWRRRLALALVCAALAPNAHAAEPASGMRGPIPPPSQTPQGKSTAGCPAVLSRSFLRLQDELPQSLCQYAGKVVLVVNTASYCGFTRQYEGLEALYARYKDRGLVVLGFPTNDFNQEPGNNSQIADFCSNTYGVKFPMFAKTTLSGKDANVLFTDLERASGRSVKWNFYKFLIGRDGKILAGYDSNTEPLSPTLVKEIEAQL